MKRLAATAAALLMAGTTSASAQTVRDSISNDLSGKWAGVYLCVAEASGGVRLDEKSNTWKGTSFHEGDNKFVVKVEAKGLREVKGTFNQRERVMVYRVELGVFGEEPSHCFPPDHSPTNIISKRGLINCRGEDWGSYRIVLNTLRYMKVFTFGYVYPDIPETYKTPLYVEVGKCSKVSN